MSGHVFVVGADLTRLTCDDVLVPTDRDLRVDAGWLPLLPTDAVGVGSGDGTVRVGVRWPPGRRVVPVTGSTGPRAWLVDTVGDDGRGLDWLLDGAREALAAVAGHHEPTPRHGRARRLVALPALGTGWGVASGSRGTLLERLLPLLQGAAREHGYDVALVLRDPRDLAAAQAVRRAGAVHWDLPERLAALGEELGRRGIGGELAVFVGAGVGAAAGLPTWPGLLDELAALCELAPELRAGLAALPPQDSAALLARELGRARLAAYIGERFDDRPYPLAHAVLAALPVHEFVTTNYDRLLEAAAEGARRRLDVLPFEESVPGRAWLLKLHGDVTRPDTVVLTREHYLRTGDHRAALAGVLHSLLLTRHVLFVGASMLDDDLIRIAHEVRSALQPRGPGPGRRLGTVLALTDDPARARLWERDVDTVAVGDPGLPESEAARRLEVLLDLVGCRACPATGYLLDPAYRGMLTEDEAALAAALAELDTRVHDRPRTASAWQHVDEVLRRLGAHSG